MASTVPRTGLKRMGLTLLLITIYIFVGLKIIVATLIGSRGKIREDVYKRAETGRF